MRQRKVKNESARLAALEHRMMGSPDDRDWLAGYGSRYLELGCGRGHFLVAKAKADPDGAYIGAEGRSSIVLRALEMIEAEGLYNARCIPQYIESPEDWFSEGELDGIYLNFSDPWPKARHEKRRLTSRSYMEGYRTILKQGGFVECKTDNDGLFQFTKEEGLACGFVLEEQAEDLHDTIFSAKKFMTQYEHRFQLLGKPIHYCRFLCP
ncbi:MAG: tRNA (guanosine(46)-N7)-methyltransferase TrmB [Firmicutes bacterium HGW-Firmicutes-11]|jgi:tRNA (guanine-N7-)-methyltransferase|nr:MAG: tRNA (guanosine(46)-N7)-methyltransferase TrmB [Firmicutes bacterium HGW-Firmicutes-11]